VDRYKSAPPQEKERRKEKLLPSSKGNYSERGHPKNALLSQGTAEEKEVGDRSFIVTVFIRKPATMRLRQGGKSQLGKGNVGIKMTCPSLLRGKSRVGEENGQLVKLHLEGRGELSQNRVDANKTRRNAFHKKGRRTTMYMSRSGML